MVVDLSGTGCGGERQSVVRQGARWYHRLDLMERRWLELLTWQSRTLDLAHVLCVAVTSHHPPPDSLCTLSASRRSGSMTFPTCCCHCSSCCFTQLSRHTCPSTPPKHAFPLKNLCSLDATVLRIHHARVSRRPKSVTDYLRAPVSNEEFCCLSFSEIDTDKSCSISFTAPMFTYFARLEF